MRQKISIFILFIMSTVSALLGEDINVTASKASVGLNESFTLVFSTHLPINDRPDFSPLQDAFNILSTSQNHNTTFINGSVNQETRWNLVLMAKQEGQVVIPSIQFGSYHSEPKIIEITASHQIQRDESLFLETEVYPEEGIYEQTQVLYTVRLYRAVNLGQAAMSEMKLNDPDAIIERLGSDSEYEYLHANGTRYVVFERKYAVFPQHAGELIFSPINFEGQVIIGHRSFFNVGGEFKRVVSEEKKVEVKPIPPPFNQNNWFAAEDVKLTQEWSADPNAVVLGEPITWTLTLTAEGCLGNNIPTIALNFPNDLKHYSDKPQISNQLNADGVTGVKQIKVALIATKAGTITLPELTINWWNLNEEQVRQIQLPAQTLQVQDSQIALNTPSPEVHPTSTTSEATLQEPIKHEELPLWAWCLIGLNGIWVIGLCIYLCKKISFRRVKPDSLKHVKQRLKKACQENDAKQAEGYLLAWAQQLHPQEKSLNLIELKNHLPEQFQEPIDELYQVLYGRKEVWRGDLLWKAVAAYKAPHGHECVNKKGEGLRELYPEHL